MRPLSESAKQHQEHVDRLTKAKLPASPPPKPGAVAGGGGRNPAPESSIPIDPAAVSDMIRQFGSAWWAANRERVLEAQRAAGITPEGPKPLVRP